MLHFHLNRNGKKLLFLRLIDDLEQNERKMPIVPENLQDFSGTMCLCVVLGEFALRDPSLGSG